MPSQQLKNKGLKVTLPRVKVLTLLENSSKRHWSAEEIYKDLLAEGEDVSLATVYRVLAQFEAAQIVTRHRFENDHSVFELNDIDQHDHVVCEGCGMVKEFSDKGLMKKYLDISESLGFQLTHHTLCLYGLCPQCQKGE